MKISTQYLGRCIQTLEEGVDALEKTDKKSTRYDLIRAGCVKEFEIILEQSGKLLRKTLKPYFASPKEVDRLNFKDIFRHAAKHDLLSLEECERWLQYRDNRNETAHDYGEGFAEATLQLLPDFTRDAQNLSQIITRHAPDA